MRVGALRTVPRLGLGGSLGWGGWQTWHGVRLYKCPSSSLPFLGSQDIQEGWLERGSWDANGRIADLVAGLWGMFGARIEDLGSGLWVSTGLQSGVIPKVTTGASE